MRVLILGATGPTGQCLVEQALAEGHEITALVRNVSKLKINNEKLTVIKGDALNDNDLLKSLVSQDAVLSALGVGKTLKSNDLMTNAVSKLIPAMKSSGVNRLIFLSAFGVGESIQYASWIQKFFFRTFLKSIYTDKAKAENILSASNLDWTMVCPVVLTNGPLTNSYRVIENEKMKGMPKISRADVADFMIKQLTTNEFLKRKPDLTH